MKIDSELAAKLEKDEQAIRIAEELARRLDQAVEVFDVEGNKLWEATPMKMLDS